MTEAMVAELPPIRVAVSNVLTSVQDMGTHLEMVFSTGRGEIRRAARQVVLAMPPRLIEEHIRFTPALPDKVQRALLARPTWMAQQAKAVVVYGSDVYGSAAGFRARVGSGNAFVHHEQAVLGEVFDASGMDRGTVALGGFLALPPRVRARFAEGLEMLITSQFVQLFGPTVEAGVMHYQDWATEPFTCASLDRREDATQPHPHTGDPCLRTELWSGRLRFSGSEFATEQAGYLEGALNDAARVAIQLTERPPGISLKPGILRKEGRESTYERIVCDLPNIGH